MSISPSPFASYSRTPASPAAILKSRGGFHRNDIFIHFEPVLTHALRSMGCPAVLHPRIISAMPSPLMSMSLLPKSTPFSPVKYSGISHSLDLSVHPERLLIYTFFVPS